jgi:hypothetical protein
MIRTVVSPATERMRRSRQRRRDGLRSLRIELRATEVEALIDAGTRVAAMIPTRSSMRCTYSLIASWSSDLNRESKPFSAASVMNMLSVSASALKERSDSDAGERVIKGRACSNSPREAWMALYTRSSHFLGEIVER